MFLTRTFVILLLLVLGNCQLMAGGWPQPKGSYYLRLSEWWTVSDQHFDQSGDLQTNTHEFGYFSTSLYAEYSFTNRWAGFMNFPVINFVYAVQPAMTGQISHWEPGDADIGLKYALFQQEPIAVSLTAFVGIPLGKDRGSLSGGLQTGDGEFNQGIILDLASGFKIFNSFGWLSLLGGYNNRTTGYSDEILYGAEGGINLPSNKITLILRMKGASSDEKGNAPLNAQSLFSNNREYLILSPEVIYNFDERWSITAGIGSVLSGKNIFGNTSFSIGVINQKKYYPDDEAE